MQVQLKKVLNSVLNADDLENSGTIISSIAPVDGSDEERNTTIYVKGSGPEVVHLLTHICEEVLSKMNPIEKFAFLMKLSDRVLGGKKNDNNN
ncbi:hypothetical protein ACPBEH_11160 [Latilactobacillus sp. 5-91]|uniref:hypothetical protein n=1 Tax=Latilactobacillus sp. 5-91 TaxID=3410924 RepID=UPI003C78A00D